jgi:hypothetical protein
LYFISRENPHTDIFNAIQVLILKIKGNVRDSLPNSIENMSIKVISKKTAMRKKVKRNMVSFGGTKLQVTVD